MGGFDRVFEINRNFRNEGLSVRHNPEFTMMEFYAAYTDYKWLMDFTESCIRAAAIAACGSAVVQYQGRELDLAKPFQRLTIVGAIQKYAPQYTEAQLQDATFLRAELKKFGVEAFAHAGLGALQLALFEETAESQLWERLTSSITQLRFHRWHVPRIATLRLLSAMSCLSLAVKLPMVSLS